ncbi:hypothetical protein DRJ19_04910, partial [Candidatus Woesearchaeota archaeon]
SGPCDGKNVTITAKLYSYELFSQTVKCQNNGFDFRKTITYDLPSGLWQISAGKYVFNVNIKPSKESKYLLIKLLSPSKKVERSSTIKITAEITDAGHKVVDANVYAYLPTGKRIKLSQISEGIYSSEYSVPYNLPLEPWRLIIIATHPCEFCTKKISAGEEEFTVAVEKAKIVQNILEPKVKTFPLEKEETIILKATYANNEPLKNPNIVLQIDKKQFPFNAESDTIFKAIFSIADLEGTASVKISAYDDANNSATLTTNFVFVKDISWYIKHLLPLLILYSAVIFFIFLIFVTILKLLKKRLSAVEKLKLLESELKELQQKYYNGKISKTAYKDAALELKKKIAELKREL